MIATRKALLIDEDHQSRAVLSGALRAHGYATLETAEPWTAIEASATWHPDLVVLEWRGGESESGTALETLKSTAAAAGGVTVMLVSADDSEDSRVEALQRGGDDYVTKPFSIPLMLARINALLRRTPERTELIEIGGLRLDMASHTVLDENAEALRLRPAEFRLLHFFMTNPDTVHSRSQLLHRVWHNREGMSERSVDVHIRRLRQALAEAGYDALIQTVRGVGYRFSSRFLVPR